MPCISFIVFLLCSVCVVFGLYFCANSLNGSCWKWGLCLSRVAGTLSLEKHGAVEFFRCNFQFPAPAQTKIHSHLIHHEMAPHISEAGITKPQRVKCTTSVNMYFCNLRELTLNTIFKAHTLLASISKCRRAQFYSAAELQCCQPSHRIHLYPFYTGYIRSRHTHTIKPLTILLLVFECNS